MIVPFYQNCLRWSVNRLRRTFRVHVVEPKDYSPSQHAEIFNAAMTSLMSVEPTHVAPLGNIQVASMIEEFDLITFPEAFLPQADFLLALTSIVSLATVGCIHVGLRPSTEDNHLFSIEQVKSLVESVMNIDQVVKDDLVIFRGWTEAQQPGRHFNIGCMFTLDAEKKLRVCFHAKLVRANVEVSCLAERHMTEANLLTLVTLVPSDKAYLTVTMQPLLCSDALQLQTDKPNCWPLEKVSGGALSIDPPDHIDIVSVANCTPQVEFESEGKNRWKWHQEFRNSFVRALDSDALVRHHYSIFVLSNYQYLAPNIGGGLSGIFVPLPLRQATYPPYFYTSVWGKPKTQKGPDNQWSSNTEEDLAENWHSLGYIGALDSHALGDIYSAQMLGFTVLRLPRDMPRSKPTQALADISIYRTQKTDNGIEFQKEAAS